MCHELVAKQDVKKKINLFVRPGMKINSNSNICVKRPVLSPLVIGARAILSVTLILMNIRSVCGGYCTFRSPEELRVE